MKIREDMINVSQGQQDARAARGLAAAAILQAIPLFVWCASFFLLFAFLFLAIGFHLQQMSEFVNNALRWLFAALVLLVVVVLARLMYRAYGIYHDVVSKHYERQGQAAAVQRQYLLIDQQRLKNEQLAVKIDLERQLPLVIKYALEAGHNITYNSKEGLQVQNYLSNVHSIQQGQGGPGQEQMLLPSPTVPTFRELLSTGSVQAAIEQEQMILGYTEGQARYGTWLDLYSCAIGGVSGSGKSTTVRFLLFQAILAAARLIMIDPHIHDPEESLAAQFRAFTRIHAMPPCDDNPRDILHRVRKLDKELKQRKAPGGHRLPLLILVIDEFNAVMRIEEVKKELAALLLAIAQEGRKFGVFAMLIGQRWSAQDIGGADIRSSLASMLAHRFTDEEQARKLVGGRAAASCLTLQQGHYLFRDTQGVLTEMITPLTEVEDGAVIQSLLDASIPASTEPKNHVRATSTGPLALSPGQAMDAGMDVVTDAGQGDTEPLTPEAYRVLELLREKRGQGEIIEEIWGLKSTDGRPYRAAVEQYRAILSALASRVVNQ